MKTKKLIYLVFLIATIICATSCKEDIGYTKRYIVVKSDDDNWTTSGIIECDSVTMINKNKATLYIDGRKMNLEGGIIKIFTNTSYEN